VTRGGPAGIVPAARLPEVARARRLLRELIDEGTRRFDARDYWHAHESWEAAWKLERGHDRDFLKGLIQFAAALHHWRRGNLAPAARLLAQARAHVATHIGPRWPVDGIGLVHEIDHAATRLRAARPPEAPSLARLRRG
jgi:hypothetical protein